MMNSNTPFPLTEHRYLEYDLPITLAGTRSVYTLEALRTLLRDDAPTQHYCFCPFCDPNLEHTPAASIMMTRECFIQLYCSDCHSACRQHTYWEDPIEPGLFMLENQMVHIKMSPNNLKLAKVPASYIRKSDEAYVKARLSRTRSIAKGDLKIEKYADVRYEKTDFDLDVDSGLIRFHIPSAIKEEIHDNAFIDCWLDSLFGEHSGFVKDWLALYCYTNYRSLPIIVLSGPRSSGKSTFAEIIGEIFPEMTDSWDGENAAFTPFFQKKLLIVEENNNDGKQQYVQLKRITGSAFLKVNEKFQPEFRVRNNIKIIITTNEFRPIHLVKEERPTDPNSNNFFMYRVQAVPAIIPNFKELVLQRLGWYIQTELKARYESWEAEKSVSQARYGIPCPITSYESQLFDGAEAGVVDKVVSANQSTRKQREGSASGQQLVTVNPVRSPETSLMHRLGFLWAKGWRYLMRIFNRKLMTENRSSDVFANGAHQGMNNLNGENALCEPKITV